MRTYRVIVLMMLSFLAGAVSHFYYSTYMTVENAKKAAVEDVASLGALDASIAEGVNEPGAATLAEIEATPAVDERQAELKRITDYLSVNNSEVIDSKVFDTKEACDKTVRAVAAEYARRGIPSTDMVETSPFPDSTGLVVMLRNDSNLYYAGCVTRADMDWAAYVHFKPKGK